MADDAKKALLIAALTPPKGMGKGDDSEDSPEDDDSSYSSAAKDFYEAAKSGDWKAAGEALETAMMKCMGENDKDDIDTEH